MRNREDVRQQLQKTRPRQSAEVVVRRSTSEAAQELTYTVSLVKRPLEVIRPEPMLPEAGQAQHPLSYLLTLVPKPTLKPGDGGAAGPAFADGRQLGSQTDRRSRGAGR